MMAHSCLQCSRLMIKAFSQRARSIVTTNVWLHSRSTTGGGGGSGVNDYSEPTIPPYEDKIGEPVKVKRARLLYQSRKRGMLENDLLLSGFAGKFLGTMEEPQLSLYDRLINLPSNDWDIYYWATGVKETPAEFDDEIMQLLKMYIKNNNKEDRTRQPDL